MSTPSVSKAVAAREDPTPRALVLQRRDDFTAVLPSHVKPDTWVRLATGALKRGKKVAIKVKGELIQITELEHAAMNNPQVFLASLLEAARLGLEPGTEQYYLTPRKEKGTLQILGIVGYQGYIELMYRAGAISSVVAECVYSNDTFQFRPGRDERPLHEIDWDSDDRGDLRLVYAYAVMKDGATSKVVVMNKAAIKKVKESSPGSGYDSSPWVKHEAAMWLKSAVRQLAKWVPTSAEYVREQLRAQAEIAAEQRSEVLPPPPATVKELGNAWIEQDGATPVDDPDVLDGEIVGDDSPYLPADPDLTAHKRTESDS